MNIWIAASDGRTDLVEKYLQNGISANAKDPNGYTPLHASASYGHTQLLSLLVDKYNGDINIRDSDGDTPLHHVETASSAKYIIEILKADPNLRNNDNLTPLDNFLQDSDSELELIEYLKKVTEKQKNPTPGDGYGENYPINESLSNLINDEDLEQFKDNVKMSLATEVPQDEESLQRQQQLQEIMNGDNVDENLERYVTDIIHKQLLAQVNPKRTQENDEETNKRSRQ